jgi:endonuclease/exonuclease/phosphatase family metal-dependent hydrolase
MKLITWNIQQGRDRNGVPDLEGAIDYVRGLADFDVLCLQEVASGYDDPDRPGQPAGGDGSDQFAQLAALLPGFTAHAGVVTDTIGLNRRRAFGNMIVSRYPVLQVFRHSLPWPADPGVMSMQRGALEATLDTPLGLVRLTTTHLEYFSVLQRTAQVGRLRELHREALMHARGARPGDASAGPFRAVPRAAAALLTGDCNFLPGSNEHTRLLAPFDDALPRYCDAWQLAHPGAPHAPTVGLHDRAPGAAPPFTFDFVCVSEDLAGSVRDLRVDAGETGSAHQPVLLELG